MIQLRMTQPTSDSVTLIALSHDPDCMCAMLCVSMVRLYFVACLCFHQTIVMMLYGTTVKESQRKTSTGYDASATVCEQIVRILWTTGMTLSTTVFSNYRHHLAAFIVQ